MKLRIEFTERKGKDFPNVVRVAKKFKTFREFEDEGVHVYSIEFNLNTQVLSARAFLDICPMTGSVYYLDDELTPHQMVGYKVWPESAPECPNCYEKLVHVQVDAETE